MPTLDGRLAPRHNAVMRVMGRVGQLAGVVVSREGSRVKFASAHDLRRSFCSRWARLVMPQVLTRLARHHSIATTMTYDVTQSAEYTADAVWDAFQARPVFGNFPGNTFSDCPKCGWAVGNRNADRKSRTIDVSAVIDSTLQLPCAEPNRALMAPRYRLPDRTVRPVRGDSPAQAHTPQAKSSSRTTR